MLNHQACDDCYPVNIKDVKGFWMANDAMMEWLNAP